MWLSFRRPAICAAAPSRPLRRFQTVFSAVPFLPVHCPDSHAAPQASPAPRNRPPGPQRRGFSARRARQPLRPDLCGLRAGGGGRRLDRRHPKILGAVADPRLRVLANRGAGLVDALSTGLAATAAPLVARMDADDIALPSRLERQIAFLDANPGVALVGAQVAHMDAGGRPTGHVSSFPTAPARIAEALMTRGCVLRHPTVMARRPALDAVGAYRRVVEGAEDYDLWLRLSERAALANLPDVLLRYRIHDAQVSHGINWRQRFAHDLALVAARARRRGEPDLA
ncbi:MAG: glycosyltransferase, partial [Solirubrobacteraceae bacterium]|nr:glycosyltransferase [Solirubrobacteraceae bacterium]